MFVKFILSSVNLWRGDARPAFGRMAYAETFRHEKTQAPPIHYSGLALPLYTMVESALKTHTPLCIGFALIFSCRGASSSSELSNKKTRFNESQVQRYKLSDKHGCIFCK